MKTYPVMLPSHGHEDMQAAILTEYADGSCTLETGGSVSTSSKAEALDLIRRRWPSAYLAEPVRDDTPPADAEPTLGDLLNLAHRLTYDGILPVKVEYSSRYCSLILYARIKPWPAPEWREYEIYCNDLGEIGLPVAIQNAKDWLTALAEKYGNPAA